jgi:outer membrane lipoprotein carrier protein
MPHKPIFPLSALAAMLFLSAPAAAQDEERAALTAASERFADMRGLCADFVQEMRVPLLDEERTSSGRLCQLRPNLFRMDFSDPEGDQVVADGTHFWVYYRSMNPRQVLRLPLDPERGGLDFYREFLEDPHGKYDLRAEGREQVGGHSTLRIGLTPRSPRGYEDATVWIDPEARLIRRIEIREENGSVRRVTLSGLEIDPALDATDFRYTPPPGVRVVSG